MFSGRYKYPYGEFRILIARLDQENSERFSWRLHVIFPIFAADVIAAFPISLPPQKLLY